ncbi:MAG: hypothetical protein IJW26_03010 [Clostridia bacterium]|nr:hypothetical protein [Clostridia bacterium]
MKKLACILLLIFNILIFNLYNVPTNAYASSNEYMRVLKNDVYLYQDDTFQTKLFIIPYGYFVYLIEEYGDYCKVSYGSNADNCPVILGYMKLDELTPYNNIPIKPYSVFTITCSQSDIMFNDYDKLNPYFNLPKNSTLTYFGEYVNENNESMLYVYYNSKLGYVDKNSIKSFTVPVSPDKIETPSIDEEIVAPNDNNNEFLKNESLQIIIIVGISIISISVVYFLFKPTKNKIEPEKNQTYEFYDEIE